MSEIGIGIVGGGYMGKAHAVAMQAVAALFDTPLRPRLEVVAAASEATAERYRAAYGFRRGVADWRDLLTDPTVEAVVIASPQETHREISEAAFAAGKHVMCEKPLGASLSDARAMVAAAEAAGTTNMIGFNYLQSPASQFARQLVSDGAIGEITWFRGEHTEDFYADPALPATWRARDPASGNLGDLAPHMINAMLSFMGPVERLSADMETVHSERGGEPVLNDDQMQFMCRFETGAMGHLFTSRIATGRKMGYAYEITGTKGAIRFDQEDQNALWFYEASGPEATRGFRKILTGPAHPDYFPFCQGPGHGTGYQDLIIIETAHFLKAIAADTPGDPSFRDGLEVARIAEAVRRSCSTGAWQPLADI